MPFVNGVFFGAPGAQVSINDQGFQASSSGGGLGAVLIGPAADGQPNTAISIASPASARSVLKGGDLLQGALNAFAGAQKIGGSLTLTVIRPELATQATSTINSAGAVAQIPLTTTSYGSIANSSKWMIQAGSTTGYKVSQGSDFVGPGGQLYPTNTVDNVSLVPITIQYTGTGTTPTYTVSDSQLVLLAATSDIGGTITFTSTTTVQQLVNQINQLAGWQAVVTDPNPADLVTALFDNVPSAAAISTSSATNITANVTAVVRSLNALNLYFTGSRNAGAVSLATSNVWTYASGGTTPVASNSDWQNAYTTSQAVTGILLIGCVIGSSVIWAMNDANAKYMATIGLGRRGYVGDALAQTEATEQALAAEFNSNRTSIVWPEQAGVDYNGNATTFAPYLEACFVMGERAAYAAQNALTQQPIPSSGMGQTVTPGMVTQGLAAGLAILAPNQQGIVVLQQDRTTWLQDTAYDKVENSTGIVVDIVTQDLQQTIQAIVGKAVTSLSPGLAVSAVYARLEYWYKQKYIVVAPVMSDVSFTASGQTITGSAGAAFAVPANYVQLQLSATALQATA